jgi:hypothetical protein
MNTLEKRINERAEERFNREFKNFTEVVSKTEIGQKLTIKINGEEQLSLVNKYGTTGGTYFNSWYKEITKYGKTLTNIELIREELIKKYAKEETDQILNKLDILGEYIGQQKK